MTLRSSGRFESHKSSTSKSCYGDCESEPVRAFRRTYRDPEVFSCYLKCETGVLMPICLWTGDGNNETAGRLHDIPCLVCRNQVDLVDGSGSMHTCDSIRLEGAYTRSQMTQRDVQGKPIGPTCRKVLDIHFLVRCCLALAPE